MKQRLKALGHRAGGRPESLSTRLLNNIAKVVPNLTLGAMQEIMTYKSELHEMSSRF